MNLRTVQTALTALCGLALLGAMLGLHPTLAYVSCVAGSWFALRAAWRSVARRSVDVNVLMLVAAVGAVLLGQPVEAAVLLFLFSLSNTLEEYAMSRTRSAIEGLMKLRPDEAIVVEGDVDVRRLVRDVVVGDTVRVLPFDQIPLDGRVVSGETSVDQAAMTGESVPVPKSSGDQVLAGTQNQDGMILVQVERAAGDTTLEKIVSLVRDAQENKASGERVSQWFGSRYTLFVIGAALLSVAIRFALGEDAERALYASLTLLVALSPCALVISTPATTLSALAWAARNGMLVRGGEFIEAVGRADAFAFDKTGTLTRGRPELAEVCVCHGVAATHGARPDCDEANGCWAGDGPMSDEAAGALRLAAAAEQYSTHPIAEAVVRAARDRGLDVPEATSQRVLAGLGVEAEVDASTVRIGQRRFFEGDTALPPDFDAHVSRLVSQGMTIAVMEAGGRYTVLGLRDEPRPEARAVIEELRRLGARSVSILTGDNPQTAATVAARLGVEDVRAGLMPADKEQAVSRLAQENKALVYVGDGVNDAPGLARAHVGVAMGGLGSDVALNAADVVLMQDTLSRLPMLVRLGRKTNAVIWANLVFAGLVIGCLTIATVLIDALLPDARHLILPIAVVGHEGSTVLVILNGLRLLRGP